MIYVKSNSSGIQYSSLNGPFFRIPGVVRTDGGAAGMDVLSAMGAFQKAQFSPVDRQALTGGICAASKFQQVFIELKRTEIQRRKQCEMHRASVARITLR